MNKYGHTLAFSDRELDRWAVHHRARLAADVRRTSPLVARLLKAAGVGADELLALAGRVIRDPDWNSGFLNRCAVVIRDAEHRQGRLGVWVERGVLCVEAEIAAGTVLVARGATCELTTASGPTLPPIASGAKVSAISDHPALARLRARVRTVRAGTRPGMVMVTFGSRTRPFDLAA